MIGTEPFSTWNNATVNSVLNFARFCLNTTERLVALNLETGRAVLADATKSAQGFEIKDLQDVGALRARIAETGWSKVSAYSKATYEELANAQAELTAAVEQRVAKLQQQSAATKAARQFGNLADTTIKAAAAKVTPKKARNSFSHHPSFTPLKAEAPRRCGVFSLRAVAADRRYLEPVA